MKQQIWAVGKTAFGYLDDGIALYTKRIKHYGSFDWAIIPDIKNAKSLDYEQIKQKEGEEILKRLSPDDYLILFDENGKNYTSLQFAQYLQKLQLASHKNIVWLIGGAYGFSAPVYARANAQVSLSAMTLSHQMIRLFAIEQIYRAYTILHNEPYHHS